MLWKHFSFLSSDCNNNLKVKSWLCFRPYIRISPYCSDVNVIKSNKTPYNHLDIFYHHPMTKKSYFFQLKKAEKKNKTTVSLHNNKHIHQRPWYIFTTARNLCFCQSNMYSPLHFNKPPEIEILAALFKKMNF